MGVAVKRLKKMSREESMQFIEMYKEKARMDREAEIEAGFERGVEKGIQQGIQQGVQKGHEQGVQEGLQQKTYQLALKMIHKGFELTSVSDITGLSKDKLLKIKKEN